MLKPEKEPDMANKKSGDGLEPTSSGTNLSTIRTGKPTVSGGSKSDRWNCALGKQVVKSFGVMPSDVAYNVPRIRAVFEALASIAPRDEIEGMLVAQMLVIHNANMECVSRAMADDQTYEVWRESLNQSNRLSRTFVAQVDALNKHRGKGQQKVVVEHVHVNSGGQAVVGTVERGQTE